MPFTKTLRFLMDYGALKLNSNALILAEADTKNIAKQSQVTAQKVASYFNDGWSEIINHQPSVCSLSCFLKYAMKNNFKFYQLSMNNR